MKIFPVGGIGSQDIAEWLASGADGFGFGSELFKPAYTLAELTKRAQDLVRGAARGDWKNNKASHRRRSSEGVYVNLETLDIAILAIYAVGIFVLAQWVSREKGEHKKDAQDYFLA